MRGGKLTNFFSCEVPSVLRVKWQQALQHIIGPVEAYAVVVARHVWHQYVAQRRVIFYIDNNVALDSFIRGTSNSVLVRDLITSFEKSESVDPSWSWFTRVPSPSNPADDPSRGKVSDLLSIGCRRDTPVCPVNGGDLVNLECPAK